MLVADAITESVQNAQDVITKAASQPLEWWMAGLTLGSLCCIYLVVRRMLGSMKESNHSLLDMVKEKDQHIKNLNDKLISLLEDRWKQR